MNLVKVNDNYIVNRKKLKDYQAVRHDPSLGFVQVLSLSKYHLGTMTFNSWIQLPTGVTIEDYCRVSPNKLIKVSDRLYISRKLLKSIDEIYHSKIYNSTEIRINGYCVTLDSTTSINQVYDAISSLKNKEVKTNKKSFMNYIFGNKQ